VWGRSTRVLQWGGVRQGGHLVGEVSCAVRIFAKVLMFEQMGMRDVMEGGMGEQEAATVKLGMITG
jgi:hypothetical protein